MSLHLAEAMLASPMEASSLEKEMIIKTCTLVFEFFQSGSGPKPGIHTVKLDESWKGVTDVTSDTKDNVAIRDSATGRIVVTEAGVAPDSPLRRYIADKSESEMLFVLFAGVLKEGTVDPNYQKIPL